MSKLLLLFRRTIEALTQAQATGEDGVAVVDREVGLKRLVAACRSSARSPASPIRTSCSPRPSAMPVLRRFSPRFLAAFRFESNVPHDPVLAASRC